MYCGGVKMFDGILGGIFDFDGDGELNSAEQAAELAFLDEEEKREALEEAGLDPDDYDDY